jgi:hypothetical protein
MSRTMSGVGSGSKAIAGKWHSRLRRIFVRHQGATTGASSNYGTVVETQRTDDKDKQDGMPFDRNRLNALPDFSSECARPLLMD